MAVGGTTAHGRCRYGISCAPRRERRSVVVQLSRAGWEVGGCSACAPLIDLGQARIVVQRTRPSANGVGGPRRIGVDVWPSRVSDRARSNEAGALGQDRPRPRIFGAACIGHDAEGAELSQPSWIERRRAGTHAVRRGRESNLPRRKIGRAAGAGQALAAVGWRPCARLRASSSGKRCDRLAANDDVDGGGCGDVSPPSARATQPATAMWVAASARRSRLMSRAAESD